MLNERILNLIFTQIDFADDELERLVEEQNAASATAVKAAINYEWAVSAQYPDDPEAVTKAIGLADNIVDLANELGQAFPALTSAQSEKFKSLFAAVFTQPGSIEPAGEQLFNACVDSLSTTRALVDYVASQA